MGLNRALVEHFSGTERRCRHRFGAKAHTVHEGVVDLDGVVQVFIIVTGATIEPGA